MSTVSLATPPQPSDLPRSGSLFAPVVPELRRSAASTNVLRRGNMEQGKALEILGHALEYLQDSRMFLIDEPTSNADAAAVQILASLSRAVFAECAEVKPFSRRWRDWVAGRRLVIAAQTK